MARDISADIERLTDQLSDLRTALAKQASASAEDATRYLAPRARQASRQLQREGHHLSDAVRRNPSAATGALLGLLAIGTIGGLLLAGGSRSND
jgi:hypothetical protein